ncbi:MAG: hypothetical protein ACKODX_21305 [Gemmata sp.]
MSEYLCLTVLAAAGETEGGFKARLTAFWSHLIRTKPALYDAVYAESAAFGATGGRVSRQYIVEEDAAEAVAEALNAAGVDAPPPDPDDTYTRYEASGTEWFQIAH